MTCGKCGAQCPDGELFCQNCGAELYTAGIDPDQESSSPDIKDKKKKIRLGKNSSSADKSPKTDETAENSAVSPAPTPSKQKNSRNMMLYLKIAGIVLLLLVVVIIIVIVSSNIKAAEGKRLAEKIPIGRNIDYCIKETGAEFSNTENPFNIKAVSKYDYISYTEEPVNIDGIAMPKWAVMVGVDRDKAISTVEYYDFTVLKKGWKGEYSKILFTKDTVSYGMDKKTVAKVMGFSPYYTKRTSQDKTTWCYRYYITDNNTGSERIFNYYVVFSDTNDTVVNAYDREIEYVNYVLGVKPED